MTTDENPVHPVKETISMKCPKCRNELLPAKDGGGFCALCGELFSKEQIKVEAPGVSKSEAEREHTRRPADSRGVPRGEKLCSLIPKLPSTLALMLDEYVHEEDDYLALHAMCAAIEFTVRFLTVVILADVRARRSLPDEDFPEKLVRGLCRNMSSPTLGNWIAMLKTAKKALPTNEKSQKVCLLPQLPEYVNRLGNALGGGKASAMECLLPMRNLLAHGGRISDAMVKQLLNAHSKRFEKLMLDLDFLSEDAGVKLVASPAEGPAYLLRGLPAHWTEFNRADLPEHFRQAGPDRMLLVTPDGILDLFPLHAYGEVFLLDKDQLVGKGEKAIHLYSRKFEPEGIVYSALGSRISYACGVPAWETRFVEIFKLEEWRARFYFEGALTKYAFNRRMDELLELFIGRDDQVAGTAERIDMVENGILWLTGKPGMGKSAFMAKLVRDYFQGDAETGTQRSKVMTIPYFFQLSEGDRCRTTSFLEAALLRLAQASKQEIRIEDDPQKRVQQFKTTLKAIVENKKLKLVFFVDGLDEIGGIDTNFIDLIFECQYPEVVWVCAGRDEKELFQRFSRNRCQWFFECHSPFEALRVEREEDEGLLPPLKAENARGFLIEELGHQLKELFQRDKKKDDGTWSNEFIEEVIRRSNGLPLYLRLLVQDILTGHITFSPGSEENLPQGLEAYYDRIVEEMGDDFSATIPAIMLLLALAKEPLPFETLGILLTDHILVGQPDGHELLDEALRRGKIMFRQAPTATGTIGYTLYNNAFKQHLLQSSRFKRIRAKTHERLCTLVVNWNTHERDSHPRDYAIRFGPVHLREAGQLDKLETLLHDPVFMQEASL